MGKKKKIQDFDFIYALAKPVVNFTFRNFYNKICTDGKENIPKNKTIILAPNHQNALMDALAILMTQPGQPVFLARADIFKQRFMAWALEGLNILPVYRQRDGRDELSKNQEIFDQAVDVLRDNVILCLMPEGQQTSKRSLFPLVKGMFRIAFSAQEELSDREIVIIPVGIDYEDYVNPGKNSVIRFGKPISVKEYMPLYQEHQAKALNMLRNDLSVKMGDLIQNIRSTIHYDAFYDISFIADETICECDSSLKKPLHLLEARQKITITLDREEKENPEKIEELCSLHHEYITNLKKAKLKDRVFDKPEGTFRILLKSLLLLFYFPLFLAGYTANFIPSAVSKYIVNTLKGDGFKSSFHVALWVILFPVYYIIAVVVLSFIFHSFLLALGIAVGAMILGRISFFCKMWIKNNLDKWRFFFRKKKYASQMKEMEEQRKKIIDTVSDFIHKKH